MQPKAMTIRSYLTAYNLTTMIETGLYNGYGSGLDCLDLVENYVAIDYHAENAHAVGQKTRWALQGNSAKVLPELLSRDYFNEPVLFWLDAHSNNQPGDSPGHPLTGELAAILAWEHGPKSVVLIDDLSMMTLPGWPSVEQVREIVGATWERDERDDIMRLTPR